jgi:long-chain acyl-CoA synthetase
VNVCQYLLEGKDNSHPALLTLEGTYTYSDLHQASSAVAQHLLKGGGQKGDRALLIGENSFFWVAAYLGVLAAGMVCVPLPGKIIVEELSYLVSSTEPRFAFVESRLLPRFAAALRGISIVCDAAASIPIGAAPVSMKELPPQAASDNELAPVSPDDLAALMFTSGTTARPRGVMVAARNIIANTNSILEYLSLTSADRIMTVLPFHYCYGTSLLHTHLRVGGSMVIEPRFMYPETVLQRMLETRCSGFAGVPSHYQILLRKTNLAKTAFPHLRYVQQAGGHLAPAFVNELRAALPRTQIFLMYGQTEATARLAYLPPESIALKPGSIGRAIPGVKLTVVDQSGREVAPGQIGEIVAEGDSVTLGYWRDEEESAKSFHDGKLHTGDLATVDEERFIYVVDRAKDFLKCGGQRVSCRYLEDVMLECGKLVEVAVIGVPDPILGEAAKAFVVPRERKLDSIREQVQKFAVQHLPRPLVPKQIVVLDYLPKNSSGKVMKDLLRERANAANTSSS